MISPKKTEKEVKVAAIQELRLVKIGRVCEGQAPLTSPRTIFDLCRDMAQLDREHFVVFHMDSKNRIAARETVSIGSLNQTIVHPREVFKAAVYNGSSAIICIHNHPSGDPTPSPEDIAITRRLCEAGSIIGIKVLDHIIIGQDTFVSFVERGLIQENGQVTYKREPSPPPRIGQALQELRKLAGMTQKALSKVTGIHQSCLSQIELGRREVKEGEARSLAGAFKRFAVDYRMFLAGAAETGQSATQAA